MVKVEVINCHLWVFLFPMKTSLCSSPCTNFIAMVTINHIIYLKWKPMPSFMQSFHGLLLPCQQCFVLAFWRLVSWRRLFSSDICDSFLSDSEQTILIFALCNPRVNQMSLLTFSKMSVCVLPVTKINEIHIYLRLSGSWRRKYTFFLLLEC